MSFNQTLGNVTQTSFLFYMKFFKQHKSREAGLMNSSSFKLSKIFYFYCIYLFLFLEYLKTVPTSVSFLLCILGKHLILRQISGTSLMVQWLRIFLRCRGHGTEPLSLLTAYQSPCTQPSAREPTFARSTKISP